MTFNDNNQADNRGKQQDQSTVSEEERNTDAKDASNIRGEGSQTDGIENRSAEDEEATDEELTEA